MSPSFASHLFQNGKEEKEESETKKKKHKKEVNYIHTDAATTGQQERTRNGFCCLAAARGSVTFNRFFYTSAYIVGVLGVFFKQRS